MKFALTSDTHYGHNKKTHDIHVKWLAEMYADLKANDVKLLIHAGDWTSNRQKQFHKTMQMFRAAMPDIMIAAVRGNHDLWQYKHYPRKMHHGTLNKLHQEWFKESNIHWLENGPLVIDDVIVVGFDGWYNLAFPPSNDGEQMIEYIEGVPSTVFLASQTYKKLDSILQTDDTNYRKSVMVTHMPPFTEDDYYLPYCANPRYFQPIKDKFDVFCVGHSHHYDNRIEDGCLILNCGSDYNQPKYLIFDV